MPFLRPRLLRTSCHGVTSHPRCSTGRHTPARQAGHCFGLRGFHARGGPFLPFFHFSRWVRYCTSRFFSRMDSSTTMSACSMWISRGMV